jgi:hypothetical protein
MDTMLEAPTELEPPADDRHEGTDDVLLRALLEIAESAERNHERAAGALGDDQPVGDRA